MIKIPAHKLEAGSRKNENGKGMVTAQQIRNIYRKGGKEITLEQAEMILSFTSKLAKLAVDQVLAKEDSKP